MISIIKYIKLLSCFLAVFLLYSYYSISSFAVKDDLIDSIDDITSESTITQESTSIEFTTTESANTTESVTTTEFATTTESVTTTESATTTEELTTEKPKASADAIQTHNFIGDDDDFSDSDLLSRIYNLLLLIFVFLILSFLYQEAKSFFFKLKL